MRAATIVEPLPRYGSSTCPFGGQRRRINSRTTLTGEYGWMSVPRQAFDGTLNDIALHFLAGNANDSKSMALNVHLAPAILSTIGRGVNPTNLHAETLDFPIPYVFNRLVQGLVRLTPLRGSQLRLFNEHPIFAPQLVSGFVSGCRFRLAETLLGYSSNRCRWRSEKTVRC